MRPTAKELLDKLAAEGSPGQIAERLEREGIVGQTRCGSRCVLAAYLQRETGLLISVGIGQGGTLAVAASCGRTGDVEGFDYPADSVLRNFVYEFDNHQYPNLVSEELS